MRDTPNGRFIVENPIQMDDLGVHPFWETSIYVHMHIWTYQYIHIIIYIYMIYVYLYARTYIHT